MDEYIIKDVSKEVYMIIGCVILDSYAKKLTTRVSIYLYLAMIYLYSYERGFAFWLAF